MSDFLSNLIARSRANPPAIQPRLPSRFEPPARLLSEFQSSAFETTAAPIAPPAVPSAANSFANESSATATPNPVNTTARGEAKSAPPTNHTASFENSHSIEAAEIGGRSEKAVVPSTAATDETNPQIAAKTESIQAISARPAFQSRRRNSVSPNEPLSSAPAIHVTIGRVEVRAIQSAAPARKPAKFTPPKLALDDYLQKRDGGVR
jgi:hypothetical protein